MGEDQIQEIDISPFLYQADGNQDARQEVLSRWNKAFRKDGFAIITGHGVSEELVEQLREDTRKFYAQEMDAKLKNTFPEKAVDTGGYFPVGAENVALSDAGKAEKNNAPDYVESIAFRHGGYHPDFVPSYPSRLRGTVQDYWKTLDKLLSLIMEISSLALGLPKEYFAPFFTKPEHFLRLAYYPAQDKVKPTENQMRYGPHTDYTGFTILKQDDEVEGLEVFNAEKETWMPVKIVKNSFVINAGDFIQRWTNDQWISNLHRVVNPPADKCHKDRLSIVFFTGPNDDVIVAPIKELCDENEPIKYKPVVNKEYFEQIAARTSLQNK